MAMRFRNSAYGPMHLRGLLRARLEPGERLVGFAAAELSPSPVRVLAQVALALIPGFGHLLAAAHGAVQGNRRRTVVLTSRRIFLLRSDRTGAEPQGRGIVAELPLSLLDAGYEPPLDPIGARAGAGSRTRTGRRAAQRRARLRRSEMARQVSVFTLTDLRHGVRIELALDRAGGGAQRLREALVVMADEPVITPAEGSTPAGGAGVGAGGRDGAWPGGMLGAAPGWADLDERGRRGNRGGAGAATTA